MGNPWVMLAGNLYPCPWVQMELELPMGYLCYALGVYQAHQQVRGACLPTTTLPLTVRVREGLYCPQLPLSCLIGVHSCQPPPSFSRVEQGRACTVLDHLFLTHFPPLYLPAPPLVSWRWVYTVHGPVRVRSGQILRTLDPDLQVWSTNTWTGSRGSGPGPVQVRTWSSLLN